MNEDSKKIIAEAFKRLPKKVQDAVTSSDLARKLEIISKKHNLHIDQSDALETETMFVMLELEPAKDYLENIERELRLTRDEATAVANDVNESILKDIKDSLRETYGEEDDIIEPVRMNAGATMKNPGQEESVSPDKEALLREIEEPAAAVRMPIRSSGLANIGERLRDRDMQVMTEAKHLDDLRREEVDRKKAAEKTPAKAQSPVEEKLSKMVTAPKKEMEVKLPSEPPKPTVVDPYREPAI